MAPQITFLLIYSKNLLFQNPPFSPVSRYIPLYWNIFVSIYIRYNTIHLETLMYRTVLWTLLERERVGGFGRMALKHV